ncbi:hypothetical protein [Methanoregula sp.]
MSRRAQKLVGILFLVSAIPILFAPNIPRFPLIAGTSCFCSAA